MENDTKLPVEKRETLGLVDQLCESYWDKVKLSCMMVLILQEKFHCL